MLGRNSLVSWVVKQARGYCIYCGGTPLSHEHMFANWLRDYIPREMEHHKAQFTVTFPDKSESATILKTGDPYARRLRCVCLGCNTGWMSKLQQDVKPYLIPMLTGEAASLGRKAQKLISAWIVMTMMTAEFIDKSMVAVPQVERGYLREFLRPPKTWRIWIGSISGSGTRHRYWHNAMALTDKKVEGSALYASAPSNTQTSAICLGEHLFIYAMSSQVATHLIRRWTFPRVLRGRLRQIWPAAAASVRWPPGEPLTEIEMRYVANKLYRNTVRAAQKAASLSD